MVLKTSPYECSLLIFLKPAKEAYLTYVDCGLEEKEAKCAIG
jgi:hypothetical protein